MVPVSFQSSKYLHHVRAVLHAERERDVRRAANTRGLERSGEGIAPARVVRTWRITDHACRPMRAGMCADTAHINSTQLNSTRLAPKWPTSPGHTVPSPADHTLRIASDAGRMSYGTAPPRFPEYAKPMTYMVVAHVVMAHVVMAYIVMALVCEADDPALPRHREVAVGEYHPLARRRRQLCSLLSLQPAETCVQTCAQCARTCARRQPRSHILDRKLAPYPRLERYRH